MMVLVEQQSQEITKGIKIQPVRYEFLHQSLWRPIKMLSSYFTET